jgi:hypothetical protein
LHVFNITSVRYVGISVEAEEIGVERLMKGSFSHSTGSMEAVLATAPNKKAPERGPYLFGAQKRT